MLGKIENSDCMLWAKTRQRQGDYRAVLYEIKMAKHFVLISRSS